MQITSIPLKVNTQKDDSLELSGFFVLFGILLLFASPCASANQFNNSFSSLEVKTGHTATGTGFLFSFSDYVITSYHVVHGSKSISIRLTNGERIDATIALKDTNNDIAILRLSKPPKSRQNIITLGDSSSVKTGDRVFTYGFPLVDLLGNAEPRYSEGFVNSLSGISNDPRLFQLIIPMQPGISGGPVFNEKGELIGIVTSSIDTDQTKKVFGATPQNVNFAIKSSHITSLLSNLPDTFVKLKGIVPVPVQQSSFKEWVKNDIVLVEAVPEFKPTVVKRDYEAEEQLRKEMDAKYKKSEEAKKIKGWGRFLEIVKPLAEQGYAEGQYNLGAMYYNGYGVPKNFKKAIKWSRLAAEQGDAGAQYNLGVMYQSGHGVPQDYKEAVKWYRLAAGQGYAGAQYNLGLMYGRGQGVPQDEKKAIEWVRLAAEQGYAKANDVLGQIKKTDIRKRELEQINKLEERERKLRDKEKWKRVDNFYDEILKGNRNRD